MVGENGAGKSTIIDALTFVLFNKPFRKINKPGLVNSVNEKDCIVEIDFETDNKKYKVIRGIKPSVFEIYQDDIMINQDSATKDYQEHLEKHILKMNFKSFSQIVVLGSASYTPFMRLMPNDRRSIIEDLLDIQIFSIMNVLVKQRLQINKENLEINRVELIAKTDKKSFIEKTIKGLQNNSDEKIKNLNVKKQEYENEIDILQNDISELEIKQDELITKSTSSGNLKSKFTKLIQFQSKMESNIEKHKKDRSFYANNSVCSTCQQDIDEFFKNNKIQVAEGKISNLEEGMKQIKDEIEKVQSEIDELDETLKNLADVQNDIHIKKTLMENIKANINEVQSSIDELQNSDSLLKENEKELEDIVSKIIELENAKKQNLEDRMLIDTSINLLKDGGIKTKIIKQYLPVINKTINKYLTDMNFFVNFNIDENFEETIKSRYRDIFSYQNFSEGEKMKIDLALLLTWRHIAKMRNSCATNLLIMDEICDASMDLEGVDNLLKILHAYGDANIFIISHRDQMHDKFKNVIKFKKVGNFSQIVEA